CLYLYSSNATPPTEIYTLSLHDALPIYLETPAGKTLVVDHETAAVPEEHLHSVSAFSEKDVEVSRVGVELELTSDQRAQAVVPRSEEHTSELQSRENLVCRLLLEKKKKK